MPRVLLCGSDRQLQQLRADILSRAGCEVVLQLSPEEALTKLRCDPFDVLVIGQTDDLAANQLCHGFRNVSPSGRIVVIQVAPWIDRCDGDFFVDAHAPDALLNAVVAPPIAWQHERCLRFEAGVRWSGWFCERCCWNRPEPRSPSERASLAARVNREFEAHSCDVFARENWLTGDSGMSSRI